MFPPEIVNHIFSYCQGATNRIMKQHIKHADDFETGVIGLKRINRDYGFNHFQNRRLKIAFIARCYTCRIMLWPCEYKKNINYDGNRMCSRACFIDYETVISRM